MDRGFGTAPAWLGAVDYGHVLVLVDYRTGNVQCLLPPAARLWCQAARTGRTDRLPPALADRLLGLGLLTPVSEPAPWPAPVAGNPAAASWGGAEHPAGTGRIPGPISISAAAALAAVFLLKRAGARTTVMRRLTTAMRTAVPRCEVRATTAQAHEAVLAVRRAAWYSPGRTACLEESVAAVFLLATSRLAVTWCHGVAPDPVRLHAWVQTDDGYPVAEPRSTLDYTPLLTIGAGHQQHP